MANKFRYRSHIYVTSEHIVRKLDPKKGRLVRYEFNHTKQIDKETGRPTRMYQLRIPASSDRKYQFGVDSNGIDRDSREAYIQVPKNALVAIKKHEGKPCKGKYILFLDSQPTFTVYFKSKCIGREKGVNQFDKVDKAVIDSKTLMQIFPVKLEKSKVRTVVVKQESVNGEERVSTEVQEQKQQQPEKDKNTKPKERGIER